MTNPQGPSNDDPSTWARPGNPAPFGQGSQPQSPPPGQLRPGELFPPSTGQEPTLAQRLQQPSEQLSPSNADTRQPEFSPPAKPRAKAAPSTTEPVDEPEAARAKRRILRDPLSILLVLIIVFALVIAGLIGAELYARHTANGKVAQVVACEVKDQATAKFGVAPLLLWQLATKHFTNITVETAGNQIRDAKGMKVQISIDNVQLKDSPGSQGTVGALDATISWSADGIRQTVQSAIPVLGAFVTTSVVTHPADGTIELKGMFNDIMAKPVVSGGGLELQIVSFNTLGFSLPRETVQSTLNDFTSNLTKNYPLGIKADSVEVTTSGVVSHFSTRNASIPGGGDQGGPNQDPCFANL